jgi:hypothetical protein
MNETNVRVILRLLAVLTMAYGGYELSFYLLTLLAAPSPATTNALHWGAAGSLASQFLLFFLISAATVGWGAAGFALAPKLARWITDSSPAVAGVGSQARKR